MTPASSTVRTSQRQPLACQECTRRKVKCDKRLPCSRCQRLGHVCAREVVRVTNALSKNRNEIDFLKRLERQLTQSGSEAVLEEVRSRVELLESGEPQTVPTSCSNQPADGSTNSAVIKAGNAEVAKSDEDKETTTSVKILEQLAWGRHYGTCYPHRACTCHTRRSDSELISINTDFTGVVGQSPAAVFSDWPVLPSAQDAERMIRFHIEHLAWHHNCLHAPTFLLQCEAFWTLGTCDHPLWMALYLSVLSVTVWCTQNSRKYRAMLELESDHCSARNLHHAMVRVLNAGNFLEHFSLYSIQAIVISTEVAHNLGMSNLNATLSSAAIRIAQSIGLHKIAGQPASAAGSAERRHETIEIELGKRVWWQMTIQDHFAIPFTDSYSINPAHFTTDIPSNCDDVDLAAREDHVPTVSSYVRTLASMARLMPSLLDKLGPIRWREPTLEQYRTVIDFDHSMRQLVSNIPTFLLRDEGQSTPSPSWLSIARRSLAITAADKIIMIHRPFLFQSFQSRSFTHTRSTCVAAAITILREHDKIVLEDDVSIWTHSAFCVTAIIVLCLEMLYCRHAAHETDELQIPTDASDHRTGSDTGAKESLYEELVRSARERLAARQDDLLAERGVRLADLILSEAETRQAVDVTAGQTGGSRPGVGPANVINFGRIMARYVQQENLARGGSIGASEPDQFSFGGLVPGSSPGEEGLAGFFPGALGTSVQSFDVWFNEIFGYERGI